MTNYITCQKADGENIFCVLGNLYVLDPLGESLHYLQPCVCASCVKATNFKRRVAQIAHATLKEKTV